MEYVYASLLLHSAGKEVNEENIKKVLEAVGIAADDVKIKMLVAALKEVDIEEVIKSATAAPIAPAVAPAAAPQPAEEKKEEEEEEEKEEEVSEEEIAEGIASLFG